MAAASLSYDSTLQPTYVAFLSTTVSLYSVVMPAYQLTVLSLNLVISCHGSNCEILPARHEKLEVVGKARWFGMFLVFGLFPCANWDFFTPSIIAFWCLLHFAVPVSIARSLGVIIQCTRKITLKFCKHVAVPSVYLELLWLEVHVCLWLDRSHGYAAVAIEMLGKLLTY